MPARSSIIRKLEDYCLSPYHPRSRHKARVFRQALGLQQQDAAWLRTVLLEAAAGQPAATRCRNQATSQARRGKDTVDGAKRRGSAAARDLLGAVMRTKRSIRNEAPSLLDVVALLTDFPEQNLPRGQVGTVVERLDDKTWLVEFSDDQGRAYAALPCPDAELLVLHYVPEAA